MHCPSCGAPDQDQAVCRQCGAPTGLGSTPSPPPAPPGATPPPPPPAPSPPPPPAAPGWAAPGAPAGGWADPGGTGAPSAPGAPAPGWGTPPGPTTGGPALPPPPPAAGPPAGYALYGGPVYQPYRASTSVGRWAMGMFGVTAVLATITTVLAVEQRAAFRTFWDSTLWADLQALIDAEDTANGAGVLTYLSLLVSMILLIIFMYQAHRHVVRARGVTSPRFSEGWTIGGWFIPLANFVIPFLVLSDLDRMSSAPERPVGTSWRGRPVSGWLWVWLIALIATVVAVSQRADDSDVNVSFGYDDFARHYDAVIIQFGAGAVVAVAMLLFVRRLVRQIDQPAA